MKQKTDLKPNFRTMTQIFHEVAQQAVCHGCELITYGPCIQMKNEIETNGSLCTGNLGDIVCTHRNTLTSTTNVQFTLSHDHQLSQVYTHPHDTKDTENASFLNHPIVISIKPKPRKTIYNKHLKSSREMTVSGKKNPPRCSLVDFILTFKCVQKFLHRYAHSWQGSVQSLYKHLTLCLN